MENFVIITIAIIMAVFASLFTYVAWEAWKSSDRFITCYLAVGGWVSTIIFVSTFFTK